MAKKNQVENFLSTPIDFGIENLNPGIADVSGGLFKIQEKRKLQDILKNNLKQQDEIYALYSELDPEEDIDLIRKIDELKKLGVDQESLISYKKSKKELDELKGKRTSLKKVKAAEAYFESQKRLGWINAKEVAFAGATLLFAKTEEMFDNLLTDDKTDSRLENVVQDIADIATFGTASETNLNGLTEKETQKYYELQSKIKQLEIPLIEKQESILNDASKRIENLGKSDKEVSLSLTPSAISARKRGGVEKVPLQNLQEDFQIQDAENKNDQQIQEEIINKVGRKEYEKYLTDWRSKKKYKNLSLSIIEDKKEFLKNAKEDNLDFYTGVSEVGWDLATAGIHSLSQNLQLLKAKEEYDKNPEGASPELKALMESYALAQQVDKQGFAEGNFMYSLGMGAAESAVFMESFYLPGFGIGANLAKGAFSSVAKRLPLKILATKAAQTGAKLTESQIKKLGKIHFYEKLATDIGGTLTASAASPMTYNAGVEKYLGQMQLIDIGGEKKVLTTKGKRVEFEREALTAITGIDLRLKELEDLEEKNTILKIEEKEVVDPFREERLKEIAKLREQKEQYQESLNSIYDPEGKTGKEIIDDISLEKALLYGFIETVKELTAEKIGGEAFSKLFKVKGKWYQKTDTYKKMLKSNFVRKYVSPIGNAAKRVRSAVETKADFINDRFVDGTKFGTLSKNAVYHTGTNKIFHGLRPELMEEIAVQLTPTYTEDYSKQLEEFTNPEFYAQILLTTAIFKGVNKTFNVIGDSYKYLRNVDGYKEKLKKEKDFKTRITEKYKEIDAQITEDELATKILMNTAGTTFDVQDYQREIKKLRLEGKTAEADQLEETSFMNLAHEALTSNTIDRFSRTLRRIAANSNFSQETRNNAVKAMEYIPILKSFKENNQGYFGQDKIFTYEMNNLFSQKSIEQAEVKIKSLEKEANQELEDYKFSNDLENGYTLAQLKEKSVDAGFDTFIQQVLKSDGNTNLKHIISIYKALADAKEANIVNKNLLYQIKTPAKQAQLRKEVEKQIVRELRKKVNSKNADEKKQELADNNLNSPENIALVNQAAADAALKGQKVPKQKTTRKEYEDNLSDPDILNPKTSNEDDLQAPDSGEMGEVEVVLGAPEPKQKTASIPDQEILFAPFTYNPKNEVHEKVIENVAKLFKNLEDKGLLGSFGNITATMEDYHSSASVNKNFQLIRKAYERVTKEVLSEDEYQSVYNSLFPYGQSGVLGNEFGIAETTSIAEVEKTSNTPEIEVVYNPITNTVGRLVNMPDDKRYGGTGLKIGVLGRDYEGRPDEEITTISNSINPSSLPYMDVRNFKEGDEVEFVFDIDYLLTESNPINIWGEVDSEAPYKKVVTVKQFLTDTFKGQYTYPQVVQMLVEYQRSGGKNPLFENIEFLKQVPVGLKNKNYTDNLDIIPGALNSYYWFNQMNVALKMDAETGIPVPEEKEERIQANRKINFEARRIIAENGFYKSTVSSKKDTEQNTRLPRTVEEKNLGYTLQFYPLGEQFENSLIGENELNKNVGFGILDNNYNLIGSKDAYGKTSLITVDGVQVERDKIENLSNFIKNIEKQNANNENKGQTAGRVVFIHKTGFDKKGNQLYAIRQAVNNHSSKQEEFKKVRKLIFKLQEDLGFLESHKQNRNSEKALNIIKAFKNSLGIDLTYDLFSVLQELYPTELKSKKGVYRQDYKINAQADSRLSLIPDFSAFENYNDFLSLLLSGEPVPTIDKKYLYAQNIHTSLVFTPITKGGETVYTTGSQPFVRFNSAVEENFKKEDIKETLLEDKKRLEGKKEALKKEIESVDNEAEKEELKEQLKETTEDLKKIEIEVVNVETLVEPETTLEEVETYEAEASYLEDENNKNTILGITSYADSVREYLDLQLDLNEEDTEVRALLFERAKEEYELLIKELKGKAVKGTRAEIDNAEIIQEIVHRTLQTTFNTVNELNYNEKDFDKASYEIDITKSLSFQVKMMLSQIKDSREKSPAFADLKKNLSLPEAFEALHIILSEVENNTLEDFVTVAKAFANNNPIEAKLFRDIAARLLSVSKTSPELVNELLYSLYQPKLSMNFVMWSQASKGKIVLDRYDSNSKNPLFSKKFKWRENLKHSGLLNLYEGNFYAVNEKKYQEVEKLYNSIFNNYDKIEKDISRIPEQDLKDYLKLFGIKLNQKIIDDLYTGLNKDVNKLKETLFRESGILQIFKKNLDTAKKSPFKLTFGKVKDKAKEKRFDLLENDNSQYNELVHLDNFLSTDLSMNTMYMGGKTVYMYQQPNSLINTVRNLKKSVKAGGGLLQDLLDSPLTSNSNLLKLLQNNPGFFEYFDQFTIGLEAIKELGTKSQSDKAITSLSDKDAFLTLFGMYASSEGKLPDPEKRFSYRKGIMSFPTLSDASVLPMLKTALIELSKDNYRENTDSLDDNILEVLQEQLLVSDLKRIGDYIIKVENSNIQFYDKGAVWITGMPSLNLLTVETENVEKPGEFVKRSFIDLYRAQMEIIKASENTVQEKEKLVQEKITELTKKYQEQIFREINNNVRHEADLFITEDRKQGKFVEFDLLDAEGNLNVGLSSSKNDFFKDKSPRQIATDYVVNYFLQQKEIQTIFAGDIAGYFKSKIGTKMKHHLPEVTEEDLKKYGRTDLMEYITNPGNTPHEEIYEALLPIAKLKVFDMFEEVQNNLSKRLKELISPGNQYPNSQNSPDYYQLMLEDVENASKTLDYLIATHYPSVYEDKAFMEKVTEFKQLDEMYEKTQEEIKLHKDLKAEISKRIPQISAYLKTASTDAQEYVTWQDNFEQLVSQGRLRKSHYALLKDKMEKQERDLENQGYISKENKLTEREHQLAILQPSKPLYSGLHFTNINGHNASRYVYIKSSSFPLTPELVEKFPELYIASKKMKLLGEETGGRVRASYQSANKVGAVANALPLSELYKEPGTVEERGRQLAILKNSAVLLNPRNFYIQQDKPFKGFKNAEKGKRDEVKVATQFEKIILGDGITKMTKNIFPAEMFDTTLLNDLEIEVKEGKVNGPTLKKIYNEISKRQQKLYSEQLFEELGINSYEDVSKGIPEAVEKLASFINKRISNKQDKQALEILYQTAEEVLYTKEELQELAEEVEIVRADFRIPLFMSPNSRKFESVMNSIINNSNITQKISGNSSPVASEEGFKYKNFGEILGEETQEDALKRDYEDLSKKGLITTPNFDPKAGLKSVYKDGVLKFAQVFVPNRLKYFDKESNTYKQIDMSNYVDAKGQIDFSKFPKEILSMFSYRIPTSSHQSGAIIEIVGFLPTNHADLLVVPKDHTIQIGEDYDIDIRNMYHYNLVKDGDNIKVMNYEDIAEKPERSVGDLYEEYKNYLDALWNDYYKNEVFEGKTKAVLKANLAKISAIAFLELEAEFQSTTQEKDKLRGKLGNNLVAAIFGQEYADSPLSPEDLIANIKETMTFNKEFLTLEYKGYKQMLKDAWKNEDSGLKKSWDKYNVAKNNKVSEKYILENNLISMYKSVFSSTDPEMQKLVTKVLSTQFSEDSADAIKDKRKEPAQYFNIYSSHNQADIMKLGADGKIGIGQHSNAVTFLSLLQQLEEPLQFYTGIDPESGKIYRPKILLGNFVFDGILGKVYDSLGNRISDYLMQSQNSATDNQKLQIMGKRNENAITMGVFSLLQMSGIEKEQGANGLEALVTTETGDKINLSYASAFTAQQILIEYTDLVKKYKSSTTKVFGNPEELAEKELLTKYGKRIPKSFWKVNELGVAIEGKFTSDINEKLGAELTVQKLYDQISNNPADIDPASQWYIFQSFLRFKGFAKQLQDLQQFTNIENGGLGISYFNTIELKDMLYDINSLRIAPASKTTEKEVEKSTFSAMFGEMMTDVPTSSLEDLKAKGFIYVEKTSANGHTLVKPDNHYAHKIVNSISLGYNLWNSLFPYDNPIIKEQIDGIVDSLGVKKGTQEELDLKYAIVSSMKDYSYSNNRELFGSSVAAVQKELFFNLKDNEGNYINKSLGAYLKDLEIDPNFESLFRQPFFKDLKIQINDANYPSTINFESGDVSPEYNARINNFIERLSKSSKELPKYNGKDMTEAGLAKLLLMYSLIADQANGATGFRKLLPLSIFETYGVNQSLRTRTNPKNKRDLNIIYNGLEKSAESLLGSIVDDQGFIKNNNNIPENEIDAILNRLNSISKNNPFKKVEGGILNVESTSNMSVSSFKRQFIQHNIETVKKQVAYKNSEKSSYKTLLKENNLSEDQFEKNAIITLNTKKDNGDYFVISDKSGNRRLYEKQTTLNLESGRLFVYKRIPILGTSGFNEYSAGREVSKSKVLSNNFNTNENTIPLQNTAAIIENINNTTITDILNKIVNSKDNKYSSLIALFRPFITKEQDIVVKTAPTLRGKAQYLDGEILVNEQFINQEGTTIEDIQQAIVEEVLHHITVTNINPYGNFTFTDAGKVVFTPIEGISTPSQLITLASIYNEAVQHYAKKYGSSELSSMINMWRGKPQEHVIADNQQTFDGYRLKDFHEFIAGIFIEDSEFKKEMSSTPYRQSGKNILEKFAETLAKFFVRILPGAKSTSIATNVFNELYSFLSETPETKSITNPSAIQNKPDSDAVKKAEEFIDEGPTSGETEVQLSPFTKPVNTENDVDLYENNDPFSGCN